jgi:2-succinyl-5-enolpyruvyl-6-hydroxy-3-cyclohexene-1-carboxylate synthase
MAGLGLSELARYGFVELEATVAKLDQLVTAVGDSGRSALAELGLSANPDQALNALLDLSAIDRSTVKKLLGKTDSAARLVRTIGASSAMVDLLRRRPELLAIFDSKESKLPDLYELRKRFTTALGNAILSYPKLLVEQPELASRIGRVIVFGKPTLSRTINRLFYSEHIEVVVVRSASMGLFDVSRRASMFVDDVTFDVDVDGEWLEAWRVADQKIQLSTPVSEKLGRREIVEQVWAATQTTDNLFLGASRMIREAEVWAQAGNLNIYASRGLAGIDGSVATATGIALATRAQTRALIGDLTLLHDASSLVIDELDGPIDLQLVVVNDHGGSIFETLEPAKQLSKESFDRLFRTPQNVNLATLAVTYGWLHIPVHTEVELEMALRTKGRVLIEVKLG